VYAGKVTCRLRCHRLRIAKDHPAWNDINLWRSNKMTPCGRKTLSNGVSVYTPTICPPMLLHILEHQLVSLSIILWPWLQCQFFHTCFVKETEVRLSAPHTSALTQTRGMQNGNEYKLYSGSVDRLRPLRSDGSPQAPQIYAACILHHESQTWNSYYTN
jgi:hypothetical protein